MTPGRPKAKEGDAIICCTTLGVRVVEGADCTDSGAVVEDDASPAG